MICFDTNTINRATSQYTGFDFNSMVKFNGNFVGASSSGLSVIGGTADNGVAIYARMASGLIDFGINNKKRWRFVCFGVETTGDLIIKISADEKLAKQYDIIGKPNGTQQRVKIPVSRENYGRYWSWEISGSCDFSVDSIEVLPIILNSGHSTSQMGIHSIFLSSLSGIQGSFTCSIL